MTAVAIRCGSMRIRIANCLRIALLAIAALAATTPAWSQSADTILVNGKILTVDKQFSTRDGIARRKFSLGNRRIAREPEPWIGDNFSVWERSLRGCS